VIFERPTIADLLGDLIVREPVHFPPKPGPDPDPSWLLRHDRGQLLAAAEQHLGRDRGPQARRRDRQPVVRRRLDQGSPRRCRTTPFGTSFAPPLPDELRLGAAGAQKKDSPSAGRALDARRPAPARRVGAEESGSRALRRSVPPLLRPLIPEWVPFFDIPDITFKVTQDVDGDGTEETISSEGFFQIRWNAGPLSNVKLIASPIAISIPECGEIIDIPCGNVPEIVRAGRMPVRGDATMYDPGGGLRRAAQPPDCHRATPAFPGPLPRPAAQSPFYGTVPIYGCVNVATTATQYRILDSYSANGIDFSPFLPIRHQAWWVTRLDAAGITTQYHYVTPDANGWYPIVIPTGTNPNAWEPPNLLLDWTPRAPGTASTSSRSSSASPVSRCRRSRRRIRWRSTSTTRRRRRRSRSNTGRTGSVRSCRWFFPCPLVRRGAVPQDVEFRVTFTCLRASPARRLGERRRLRRRRHPVPVRRAGLVVRERRDRQSRTGMWTWATTRLSVTAFFLAQRDGAPGHVLVQRLGGEPRAQPGRRRHRSPAGSDVRVRPGGQVLAAELRLLGHRR
jgi:hypothetical protein